MGRGSRTASESSGLREEEEEWLGRGWSPEGEERALEILRERGMGNGDIEEFIPQISDLRPDVRVFHLAGQSIQFRALLRDEEGQEEVRMVRTIDLEEEVAYHNSLEVRKRRGEGIGSRLLRAHIDFYRKLGLRSIELYANSDLGGYFWARRGFRLSSPEAGTVVRKRIAGVEMRLLELRERLRSLEDERLEDAISDIGVSIEFLRRNLRDTVPEEVASFRPRARVSEDIIRELRTRSDVGETLDLLLELSGDDDALFSGKTMLLGTGWSGSLDLS